MSLCLINSDRLSDFPPMVLSLDNCQDVNPMGVTAFACAIGANLPESLRQAHLEDVRKALTRERGYYKNGETTFAAYERGFRLGIDPYHEVASNTAVEKWKDCIPRLMYAMKIAGKKRPINQAVLNRLVEQGVIIKTGPNSYSFSRSKLEAMAEAAQPVADGKSRVTIASDRSKAFH